MSALGWILVMSCSLLAVLANLLLRIGVERAGGFFVNSENLSRAVLDLVRQPLFDLGFVLYGVTSLVWFRVLSTEPLSVAYPVLISSTFILVNLGAVVLFHETISYYKILGLFVIIIGVFVVSNS